MRRAHVLHPDWSSHHRPTAAATMSATCDITRDGTGDGIFDPATGKTTPPPRVTVAADAPCRVQRSAFPEQARAQAEQVITTRTYLVALPHDVPEPKVDDLVEITASVDADLVGRSLRVLDVRYASEQWQRDLICQDDLG
jgi:hypothetical protein